MDTQTARLETYTGRGHWIDGLLRIIEVTLDSFVGICAGAIVGWLSGLCAGHAYVKRCQPVYASAYSSLSEISEWMLKPSLIADIGAYIGAVVGTIIVLVIGIRVWRQNRCTAHMN